MDQYLMTFVQNKGGNLVAVLWRVVLISRSGC